MNQKGFLSTGLGWLIAIWLITGVAFAQVKSDSMAWRECPVVKSICVDIQISEILDSFPAARNLYDTLLANDFTPVKAEKVIPFGLWIHGEGAIGAIRFDHGDVLPGMWIIVGRGFGGKTVSALVPADFDETYYNIYISDSITSEMFGENEFRPDMFVVKGIYPFYRQYRDRAMWTGSDGSFYDFFGYNLGYFTVSPDLARH